MFVRRDLTGWVFVGRCHSGLVGYMGTDLANTDTHLNWISHNKVLWTYDTMSLKDSVINGSKAPRGNIKREKLTNWGRVTHISVNKIIIIGSDNGLSPGRHQAIIWNNAGILLIGPLGINFSGTSIEIPTFSIKKMHLKMSSAKWRLFHLGLNELTHSPWHHFSCMILKFIF